MSGEYPTEKELRMIHRWKFDHPQSFVEFMDFVQSVGHWWNLPDPFGWTKRGRIYRIATGGWSGNESIIYAMQANFIFWSVCWVSSRRGGGFVFRLPDPKTFFRTEVS